MSVGVHCDRQDNFSDVREEPIDQSHSRMVVRRNFLFYFHAVVSTLGYRCRINGLYKEKRTLVQVSHAVNVIPIHMMYLLKYIIYIKTFIFATFMGVH